MFPLYILKHQRGISGSIKKRDRKTGGERYIWIARETERHRGRQRERKKERWIDRWRELEKE